MPKKVRKTRRTGVYVLTLTGQGDTYIKLIDKETWNWISSYCDVTCPPAILARMREEDPDAEPHITRGSWENDRALQAPAVYGNTFYSMKEAMQYITKHKMNVIDSWEGCIY